MKVIVRCTVILPDYYARIQRLYDYGTWFQLEESRITDLDGLADFVEQLNAHHAKTIDMHNFIDDDDLKEKTCIVYEYISE